MLEIHVLHVFRVLMTFLHGFVKISECMLRLAHFCFKRSNVLQTLTNLSFRRLDSAWWLQVGSLRRLGSNKRTCSRKNSSRDAVLMETVQGAARIGFQRRLMLICCHSTASFVSRWFRCILAQSSWGSALIGSQ